MPPPTSDTKVPTTISTTHKNHPIYSHLLARAFTTDPVFTYIEGATPWYARPLLTYRIIRSQLLAASHGNRALFIAAASNPTTTSKSSLQASKEEDKEQDAELNPQCTAVILPPGESLLGIPVPSWISLLLLRGAWRVFFSLGLSGWKKFEKGYITPVEAAKASVFAQGETYYYVAIIWTAAQHRGKGLAQSVLGELTERAQREGKPVWLEASSAASRRVYRRCGFVDVGETIVLGRGEVDGTGEAAEGEAAVGVPVFPMVWWPKGDPRKTME
ncbi:uncharacterized protein CC84DRAFT_1168173 [Paraphaeosphaeria sporulosa]|uniref:N-acetyltransferase domain-containing protein n=1 Tax=Paraphaeosphaeria sporulosa TaxID=1460663 RepID=A0A177C182_9PLEO|nr:uncharacterized protein CC84DRAFT_1168173 [Paraphaeosphaeria sporulosa]OAG00971.1 hypothetical protein CC84DRAFT_1168173 [Paraphaeosphaeria sporulosa]